MILPWFLHFCCGLILFKECVALELKMPFPYGPVMCESLEKRGCDVKFHRENLTCVLHSKERASGNKTRVVQDTPCNRIHSLPGLDSRNRTDKTDNVTEGRKGRIFISQATSQILELNLMSGDTHRALPVTVRVRHMMCGNEETNIYFLSETGHIWFCTLSGLPRCIVVDSWSITVRGITIDSRKHLVFAINRLTLFKLKIGRYQGLRRKSIPLPSMIGIAIAPTRELVFVNDKLTIYCVDYNLMEKRIIYTANSVSVLAYYAEDDSLYFGEGNVLMKLLFASCETETIMILASSIRHIDIHGGMAVIYHQNLRMLTAINVTSRTNVWFRNLPHEKNVDFCLL